MIKIPITFHDTEDILKFMRITKPYPFHMDLVSGKRTVDAKSLLGVLAIGHARSLNLVIHETSSQTLDKMLEEIADFVSSGSFRKLSYAL